MVSAKGSPGVTTTAAALVAVSGGGLLVEMDPSGGTLGSWSADGAGEPGLVVLASRLRRPADVDAWGEATAEPLRGVPAIVGPTAEAHARATVEAIAGRIGLATHPPVTGVAVVDAGRWSPSQGSATRVTGCDVIALTCRSTVEGIEAARWMLDPLTVTAGAPVVLLLVGDGPYRSDEVARTLGAPVAATIAWDPSAVTSLRTYGASGRWRRSQLARSARAALDSVRAFASPWRSVGDG
jgi:hypothetical protein